MNDRIMVPLLVFILLAGSVAVQEATADAPFDTGRGRPSETPAASMSKAHTLRLAEQTLRLRNDGSSGLQQRRLAGDKAPASLNAILMMCDFSDSLMLGRYGQVPGDFPPPQQSEIYYSAHDSVFFDHLMQDVADYYANVSGDALTFDFTVHPRTVNLPQAMGWYGNHPEEGEQSIRLAADVVAALDDEIDFSLYDTVILVHAGAGEETDILGNSPEQIYSTYLDPHDFSDAQQEGILENPYIPSADFPEGQGIDKVLVLPECEYQDSVAGFGGYFGSLGVYCFEVGLRLGMLSLSDFTPGGRPDSQGIGEFGLMGYGLFVGLGWIPPHPCAFNKQLMGWLAAQEVEALGLQQIRLTPCERTADPNAAVRVPITGQEYWLLAYRLQDPDGNRIFTHPGDLNSNNVPDFFDADSDSGDGTPTGYFDPATDTRERLLNCEWDFFMSENSARGPWIKGAGSGVYLWHIDEGVVRDVFDLPVNLFNADPARKSVDLEEADGIQDLDSRVPSEYLLGGDDDSFRGEDTNEFGPDTLPPTDTAGGARTEITFAEFSDVVLDSMAFIVGIDFSVSPPDTLWGFTHADTVTCNLYRDVVAGDGPGQPMTRRLPAGVDLRGSHVCTADLDDAGGSQEILLAGRAGEVFALNEWLEEYLDHDGDPDTVEPLVVGMRNGDPVVWNQPLAVGDLDGDAGPEIILTGPRGLYAFNSDGSPVRDIEAGAVGLYVDLPDCALPPVLITSQDMGANYEPGMLIHAGVVVSENGDSYLRSYGVSEGPPIREFNLGSGLVQSIPVQSWGLMFVAVNDTAAGDHRLVLCDIAGTLTTTEFALQGEPGSFPVAVGLVDPNAGAQSTRFVTVPLADGGAETVVFDDQLRQTMGNRVWGTDKALRSPLAVGGAFVSDGALARVGHNGEWLEGWPRRPLNPLDAADDPLAGGPIVVYLADSDLPLNQFLFPARDGRIYGTGMLGETDPAWLLAGPARCAGTPAVRGRSSGEELADLVAVGTFAAIEGLDDEGRQLVTEQESWIYQWPRALEAAAPWPMWGGSPWRNGGYDLTGWTSPPMAADGSGLVAGSHICYPNPLTAGPLTVRGNLRSPGRVRTFIYNLEGEEVVSTSWETVSAREPFALQVNVDRAVSGMYLCRLVSEFDTGGSSQSVVPFAIVR